MTQPIGGPSGEPSAVEHSAPLGSIRTAVLIGVVTAGAVVALRVAGIVHGITAILLLIALTAVLPRPVRVGERVLVVTVVVFGWIPLTGWFPHALTRIDLPGLALALALGAAAGWRTRVGWSQVRSGWSDGLAIAAGAATTLWWAIPFIRGGAERRLALLLGGWDHVAHLAFYSRILQVGSFGPLDQAAPTGDVWKGWDYPQGMHHAWATVHGLLSPAPASDPSGLVNAYSAAVLVTAGVTVMLAALAISRLVGGGMRLMVVALPTGAAVAVFLSVGPGSVGISFGFANFLLTVVALATAASFAIRPSPSLGFDTVVICGCLLIGAYNWYPMVAVAAPMAVPLGLRIVARLRSASQTLRVVAVLAVVGYVTALALPALFTLRLGAETLNRPGAIPHLPPTWLAAALIGLVGATLWARPSLPRMLHWLLLGIVMIGATSLTALAAFQLQSGGEPSYYFEKFALGVTAFSVLVIALIVTDRFTKIASAHPTVRMVELVPMVVVAVLILAPQVPGWSDAFGSYADGEGVRQAYMEESPQLADSASDLLMAATRIDERPIEARFQTVFIDTDGKIPSPILSDSWLAALTGTWTEDRALLAGSLVELTSAPTSILSEADLILSLLDSADPASYDLVAEQDLLAELARRDPAWIEGSVALSTHN